MSDDAAPVEALRNLGPASGKMRRAIGLSTIGALRDCGAASAFVLFRASDPPCRATCSGRWPRASKAGTGAP